MRSLLRSVIVPLLASLLTISALAADDDLPLDQIPAAVLKAVKDKFPTGTIEEATKVEDDGVTIFEITIEVAEDDITVSLKADGTILEISQEIEVEDLPAAVTATIKAKYPESEFEDIQEITRDALVTFQVTIEVDEVLRVLVLDQAGKLLEDEVTMDEEREDEFTKTFAAIDSELVPTGRNPYFILEPGYQLSYEGTEDDKPATLTITVLDETKKIGDVTTRIIEERETRDGQVIEVSRNYFAICKRTNNVYYFGEDVDMYKDGKVVSHEGSWLSGADGAKFGLAMPGSPLLGARYYQEIAPGKAMDRAEVTSLSETFETPAGNFENVLEILETSPLEPESEGTKLYAAGVGLLQDGELLLVKHGFLKK